METKTLDIPVILPDYFEDCERCMERLKETLLGLDGVYSVEVDPVRHELTLTYDSNYISLGRIEDRARRLGVEIAERYTHESLRLDGLDCPDCAMKLERGVSRLKGVFWSSVNYATSVLSVEYDPLVTSHGTVVARVHNFGYDIARTDHRVDASDDDKQPSRLKRKVFATSVAGVFLTAGIVAPVFHANPTLIKVIFAVSIIAGGFYPARSGIFSLRAATMDTNLLMTLAAIGAIVIGEWREGAGVLFLFSLGSMLESLTVSRTRDSIRSLVDLTPTEASVIRSGAETSVPLDEIDVGETVVVRPGERIPLDGVVTSGSSSIDEAPITGESMPKEKSVGDQVYSGTINQRGSLEVRVTSLVGEDTLSKIIHLVEEAQAQKAPSQQYSERFGRIYTPIVVGIAVAIALYALFEHSSSIFRQSLVLLVVSCPCALVISTPVAIVAAIGNAARNGILIKGGAHLEELGRVAIVAFDKTGTLTTGKMEVTDVIGIDREAEEVLKIAASVESRSEHHIAESILKKSVEEGLELYSLVYFEALPGLGARGITDNADYHIGNERLLERLGIQVEDVDLTKRLHSEGKTLVYVVDSKGLIGVIAVADGVRNSSFHAIEELKRAGIAEMAMLTGDSKGAAEAVARRLNVTRIESELLPEEKVERVKTLTKNYGKIAMVGDGINDAPALAAADVGVVMGGAGSHAAIETADVVLMADDLTMLPYGIKLSRSALRIIKQNLVFSVMVVVGLVVAALLKKMNLTGGIIAHEASALIVIGNGMRLLKFKR